VLVAAVILFVARTLTGAISRKSVRWAVWAVAVGSAGYLGWSAVRQSVAEEIERIRQARVAIEPRIWEIDLLAGRSIDYLSYPSAGGEARGSAAKVSRRLDGVEVQLPRNYVVELTRPIRLPRYHLGKVFLWLRMHAGRGMPGEPSALYLLRRGRDPIVLNTFSLIDRLLQRHDITSEGGSEVTVLLRIYGGDRDRVVTLERLAVESVPAGGTFVIHATRVWDGSSLNGYDDDFWYRVEKLEKERYLFYRKVKLAADGFTRAENLAPGTYRITAVLNSVVLRDFGEVEITEEAGWFGRFVLPRPTPIDVVVVRDDGRTLVAGADIVVDTNQPDGGPMRGGEESKWRILTGPDGSPAKVWLYPAARPDKDWYVIRARHGGREIGRLIYLLGPNDKESDRVTIVSTLRTEKKG
jgi:hypothetical protein